MFVLPILGILAGFRNLVETGVGIYDGEIKYSSSVVAFQETEEIVKYSQEHNRQLLSLLEEQHAQHNNYVSESWNIIKKGETTIKDGMKSVEELKKLTQRLREEILEDYFYMIDYVYELVLNVSAIWGWYTSNPTYLAIPLKSPAIKSSLLALAVGINTYVPIMYVEDTGLVYFSIMLKHSTILWIVMVAVVTPLLDHTSELWVFTTIFGLDKVMDSTKIKVRLQTQLIPLYMLTLVKYYYYYWLYKTRNRILIDQAKLLKKGKKKRVTKAVVTQKNNNSSSKKDVDPSWLHHACLYGHRETLKSILAKHKASIDINGLCQGQTPLHLASAKGHLPIVQIILANPDCGLEINRLNSQGHTALDLAAHSGSKDIFIRLMKIKKIHVSDNTLAMALEEDRLELIKLVLDKLDKSQKQPEFECYMDRYLSLLKEAAKKKVSSERKAICRQNLAIYKKCLLNMLVKPNTNAKDDNQNGSTSSRLLDKKQQDFIQTILQEYECPVCLDRMKPPRQIFACTNDHYICSVCLDDPKISTCPLCREDYRDFAPRRRVTAERMAERLFQSN